MATLGTAIAVQARDLIGIAAFSTYYVPDTYTSIVSIERGKDNIKTFTRLCQEDNSLYGKVDDRVRQEIEAILKKAEKKFAFAEQVMEYKLKGRTAMSDPRLEKMIGKLTRMKESHLPQQQGQELQRLHGKLVKCRERLSQIVEADGGSNGTTAAYSLIDQIERRLPPSSQFSFSDQLHDVSFLKQGPLSLGLPTPSLEFFFRNVNLSGNPPPSGFVNPFAPKASPFPPLATPRQPYSDSDEELDYDDVGIGGIIEVVEALSKRNVEGFNEAVELMVKFNDSKFVFSMTGGNHSSNVIDRISFHLYHIQMKETPDKVDQKDANWGLNAFQTEVLSTPDQKFRAAQRVQLEMFLELLANYIEYNEVQNIQLSFDAIEKMNLDSKDLPQGQSNAAHALFGKFYHAYVETRKDYTDLEDPLHEKFGGEFGRKAFRGEVQPYFPYKIKLKVVEEFVQELKTTWGI